MDNHEERNFPEVLVTQYYYFGAQRVAMRREGVVYFLVGDHLGTTSLVLDVSGNRVAESRHYPYGGERWSWVHGGGAFPTDYRWTGQRSQAGVGLYHMGARFYDPCLARWIQPDTLVPDPGNPQSLNRFAYVRGNPLKFVDPTGHMEDGECGLNGEQCSGEPPDIEEIVAEILQGMVDSIFDPARTDPIVISLEDGTNLVIMPVGADPLQERPEAFGPVAGVLSGAGIFMDFIEVMSLIANMEDVSGLVDVGLAGAVDIFSGDTWIAGKPHPDLPPMFLVGQDVLWTAGVDYAGPWAGAAVGLAVTGNVAGAAAGKKGTDFVTSCASVVYDWDRALGRRTSINAGISLYGDYYVLYYPSAR